MKIEDIEAFVCFVNVQSTSLAAQQLGISQPAITRRIQNLESDLGLQLFDRNTRPLKLTQLGFQIFEQCAQVTAEIDALGQLVNSYKLSTQNLRIGIATSLSDTILSGILEDLKQSYPTLNLEISTGWGIDLLDKFKEKKLDCIFSTTAQTYGQNDQINIEILGQLQIVPTISKKLKKMSVQHLADCQSLGWILNTEGCGFRQYLVSEYHKLNQLPNIKIEVTGTNLQMNLLAQGLGVGLLPKEVFEKSIYAAQLTSIELTDFNLSVQLFYMIQPDLNEVYQSICQEMSRKVQGILGWG
ncbi:LysR family transcriptional regulator [Acinetobacter calcoaceticus]|uniref:LysR family transcriptional regulator n=1 Tax=Acinetobacter calcoaceticus TaxID=471 RepID=UPI002276FB52|nr:LysR family transcriptional regulator [Acinetobacter calcoaceticus]GLG84204.1 LysR family transcriptional regulator [Acinetobacter calcoaceticus]